MLPNTTLRPTRRTRLFSSQLFKRRLFLINLRELAALTLSAALIFQVLPAIVPGIIPVVSADTGVGSISLASFGTAVTENFDTLANTGTSSTLPTGWYFVESGTNANLTYSANPGTSNAGDTYSYGAASNTERALGGLLSGSLVPVFGAKFTNNTGGTITSLDVSYRGEEWRLGTASRNDQIDFEIGATATDLTTGTYVAVNQLDFITPNTAGAFGARDGNNASFQTSLSHTITGLSISSGATFFIRWTDFNATGADDGLAVDDFSITANGTPGDAAPQVNSSIPTNGAINVSSSANISITFSEAVNVGTGWFEISCTSSGLRQVGDTAVSGGPTTYSIDPNTNFAFSEQCTVTVFATEVTDQDVNDPPDVMAGNASFTFTVVDPSPTPGSVVISQVYGGGGNTGATLTNDFIELYNRTAAPINITGWSVQYQSAAGPGTWQVTSLTGSIQPGKYYLVQEAAGTSGTTPLPTPDATGSIAMSATAGKVALVGNSVALAGACPGGAIVDQVGYGSTATCFEGAGPTSGTGNTTAVLRKRRGCTDTDNNNLDFTIGTPNPRNSASPFNDCSILSLAIHDIQGSGLTSPFVNQDVTTGGIVTALKSNGFFLQVPDANVDANPLTSEGIFVFTGAPVPATVNVGDAITVNLGSVVEFFNLTEINTTASDLAETSSGNPLPAPIALTNSILDPTGTITQLERYEGMRLHADSLTTVSPTNEFAEAFTVLTGVARPFREPGIEASFNLPAGTPCCVPRFDENPERIMVDTDGQLNSLGLVLTTGVTLTGVTGPLDFTFDDYKILPDVAPTATANMVAVPVRAPTTEEFTVGSFNMERFLGAADVTNRLNKISLAIRNVMRSPDIIGVEEVGDLSLLETIANQLNADTIAGGGADPGYVAYLEEGNDIGGIDVGFLVKSTTVTVNSVTQVGLNATFTDPTDSSQDLLNDRPPLFLRATVTPPAGAPFPVTVIVNHLRSLIDVGDTGPTGTRVRAKRQAQAEFIANEIQLIQGSENVVSVGDYNAFEVNDGYVDVMGTIRGNPTGVNNVVLASNDLVTPDLVDLLGGLTADQQYSFVFVGNAQTIDHVLVDQEMLARNTGFAYARNNADFPEAYRSDASRSERASDHDMPVAYFSSPKAATTTTVSNVTATYSSSNQALTLTANVASANTVNEGTVTFTVTNGSNVVIGSSVIGAVSGGVATALYTLPGGTTPQALTITGEFSGGVFTHPSTGTGTLSVTYAICLDYDPTKAVKSGATYPIKIQLCDINGSNVSSPDITVTAVGAGLISTSSYGDVMDAGNANPDNNFRFTSDRYMFNLKTTGLTTGIYNLYFTAGTDPVLHAVQFRVK